MQAAAAYPAARSWVTSTIENIAPPCAVDGREARILMLQDSGPAEAFDLRYRLLLVDDFRIFGLKIEQAGLVGIDVAIGTRVLDDERGEAVLECIECRGAHAPRCRNPRYHQGVDTSPFEKGAQPCAKKR